jgi:hypothetical protein
LILESRESMERRGATPRGRVLASAAGRFAGGDDCVAAIRAVYAAVGSPPVFFSSANNTWVDRAEAAAVSRERSDSSAYNLYGRIVPELYSAGPLAAVAAALMRDDSPADPVGILCTGYSGTVSAVSVAR